ncbi:MAG: hypothetical protein LBK76_09920 [Verrucomicrobiales bacterium]|jgi:hypothetical protein|nr:hypothetical protein [Verrucomicrobiales bacterium]
MKLSVPERARRYVLAMPPAISGQHGHDATFAAACALVKGFALTVAAARPLLMEWNRYCRPPWAAAQLEHKLVSADTSADKEPRGYLRDADGDTFSGRAAPLRETAATPSAPAPAKREKPKFDPAQLRAFAGAWAGKINSVWLANRSALDPATVSAELFLRTLYPSRVERVLIFTDEMSQGQALWPDAPAPTSAPRGVWFLAQPVDGAYHPNPRSVSKRTGQPQKSRRSAESVLSWRYMVLESDEAPAALWLAAVAQLPFRLAALYTSGGRSVHALVQLDALTKSEWDAEKAALKPGLVTIGADPGALSAVRLTRLPGCWRGEKRRWQKLLYVNPSPAARPLAETPAVRDVEKIWGDLAAAGVADNDETGGAWLRRGLEYYASVSGGCRAALEKMQAVEKNYESEK